MLVERRHDVLGEFLVDRHVLSRDDLEEAHRRVPTGPASRCRRCCIERAWSASKDLTAAIAETVGVRVRRLPPSTPLHHDAATLDPRRSSRATDVAVGGRLRRPRSWSSRSPTRATTTRCRRSATRPATRSSRRRPTAYEILHAHRHRLRTPIAEQALESRRARARRRRGAATSLHVNELLEQVLEPEAAPTSTSPPGIPPGDPGERRAAARSTGVDPING